MNFHVHRGGKSGTYTDLHRATGCCNIVLCLVNNNVLRFEVFTAVTMKNDVFWDVTLCGSCKNRRFGGT
jgi:hypothetical protein